MIVVYQEFNLKIKYYIIIMINKNKKIKDNINNKIRYYKNKYGYIITENTYNEFINNLPIIKKIYHLHDFICTYDQFKIPYNIVNYYASNYELMKLGYSIKHYLLQLKKINSNKEIKPSNENHISKKILIEF